MSSIRRVLGLFPKRKVTKSSARKKLVALRDRLTLKNEKVLLGWIIELLDEVPALSSVDRYASEVRKHIIQDLAETKDITTLRAVEYEVLYNDWLEINPNRKHLAYKARRLDSFHDYLVREYSCPPLEEPLSVDSSKLYVRAVLVPEHKFKLARERILEDTVLTRSSRESLWVLFTLIYRTGMRRADALTLTRNDVAFDDCVWLLIRNNRYADTKGRNPFRVPVTPLLRANEKERVLGYLQRKLDSTENKDALLFPISGSPTEPWVPADLSRLVDVWFDTDESTDRYTLHAFRHTRLSALQLVLLGDERTAVQFSGYNVDQYHEIRSVVLNGSQCNRDNIYCLAAFAGHSSPSTTLTHYLHLTDLLAYEVLRQAKLDLTDAELCNLAGVTRRVISRWQLKGDPEDASVVGISKAITQDLKRYAVCIDRRAPEIASEPDAPAPEQPPGIDLEKVRDTLEALSLGKRPQEIAQSLSIDERTLHIQLQTHDFIREMTTRKGSLRHWQPPQANKYEKVILPPRPSHVSDRKLASQCIGYLERAYENQRESLVQACRIWLTRSNVSNRGVVCHSPDEARAFLSCLNLPAQEATWLLEVRLPLVQHSAAPSDTTLVNDDAPTDDGVLKHWSSLGVRVEAAKKPRVRAAKYQEFGVATLSLEHPESKRMIKQSGIGFSGPERMKGIAHYSSSALGLVLWLTTVAFVSPETLEAWAPTRGKRRSKADGFSGSTMGSGR